MTDPEGPTRSASSGDRPGRTAAQLERPAAHGQIDVVEQRQGVGGQVVGLPLQAGPLGRVGAQRVIGRRSRLGGHQIVLSTPRSDMSTHRRPPRFTPIDGTPAVQPGPESRPSHPGPAPPVRPPQYGPAGSANERTYDPSAFASEVSSPGGPWNHSRGVHVPSFGR